MARPYETVVLPDLLLVDELALLLRRTPASIRRLIRAGEIPATLIGSQYVIEREALLEAVRRGRHDAFGAVQFGEAPQDETMGRPAPPDLALHVQGMDVA